MKKIKRRKLNWSFIIWDLLIGIVGAVALLILGGLVYLFLGGKL